MTTPRAQPADLYRDRWRAQSLNHFRRSRPHAWPNSRARAERRHESSSCTGDAVNIANRLWETAQSEGLPDPEEARQLVDNLAQVVAQNRTALVALTALKEYDNYTFTQAGMPL
jgi:hypothetical protein